MANPKNVELIVGTETINGFSESDIVLAPVTEDDINVSIGVRGEESISENVEGHGTLVFGLHNTSKEKIAYLEGLRATKTAFPIMFKDFSTDSGIFQQSPNARFMTKPTHTRSKDGGNEVVYTIHIPVYNPLPI